MRRVARERRACSRSKRAPARGFAILDARGRLLCGDAFNAGIAVSDDRPIGAAIVPGRGVVLAVPGSNGGPSARAFFPQAFIAKLATPASRAFPFASALVHDEDGLELATIPGLGPLDRMETTQTDLGVGGLALRTSIRSAPITASLVVALLLPLMMWAAAAGIGWFVVDRLLIRPLRQLRASVAAFQPGEIIDPGAFRALPAQEISRSRPHLPRDQRDRGAA